MDIVENRSAMRRSVASLPLGVPLHDLISVAMRRRGCFKWLPVIVPHDGIQATWCFSAGSLAVTVIPCIPLINLFEHFWSSTTQLPLVEEVVSYLLLMIIGALFFVASWAFRRSLESPAKSPLFTFYHFATDELFAMWMFSGGILISVPVAALQVIFCPKRVSTYVALLVCVMLATAVIDATLCCYPTPKPRLEIGVVHKLGCVAWLHRYPEIARHFANDWLFACWLLVCGCALACILCLALLIQSGIDGDKRGIYDFASGFVACLLFLFGSMYLTAGSYDPLLDPDDLKIDHEAAFSAMKARSTNFYSVGSEKNIEKCGGLREDDGGLVIGPLGHHRCDRNVISYTPVEEIEKV